MKLVYNDLMKDQFFKPTAAMKLYAYHRSKQGENETERSLAAKIGTAPETITRWKKIKGFKDWLDSTVARYRVPIVEQLEKVALENLHDFRFWKSVAQKYNYLTPPMADDEGIEIEMLEECEHCAKSEDPIDKYI